MLARMPPINKNTIVLGSAFKAVFKMPMLKIDIITAPKIIPDERTSTPDKGSIFLSPIFSIIGAMPHTIAASIAK